MWCRKGVWPGASFRDCFADLMAVDKRKSRRNGSFSAFRPAIADHGCPQPSPLSQRAGRSGLPFAGKTAEGRSGANGSFDGAARASAFFEAEGNKLFSRASPGYQNLQRESEEGPAIREVRHRRSGYRWDALATAQDLATLQRRSVTNGSKKAKTAASEKVATAKDLLNRLFALGFSRGHLMPVLDNVVPTLILAAELRGLCPPII